MAVYQTQGFTLDNSGKRIVVDPITRIEGHLRIEVNVDKDNVIRNAVSTGTMWRGLEVILKGRDPRDAWAFIERICGVCTGVHALASVRAVEDAIGIKIPKNANIIRNLMHATLYAQDHLVHFYHLHALDWVDVVSALKADPKRTSEIQQSISSHPNSSPGVFPRRAEPAEEVRRERPARHLRQRATGAIRRTSCRRRSTCSRRRTTSRRSTSRRRSSRSRRSSAARTRTRTGWSAACRARSTSTARARSARSTWRCSTWSATSATARPSSSTRSTSPTCSRSPASTRTGRSGAAACRART